MRNNMVGGVALALLVIFVLVPVVAAQELTDREKRLMRLIEDLEKRVSDLEKQVHDQKGPAASPQTATTTVGVSEAVPSGGTPLTPYWKEGIRLDSADGAFKLRIGGRTQVDFAEFNVDQSLKNALGDIENGVEFRRARLYVSGNVYEDYEFKAQYDFAGGTPGFRDVYLAMNNIPYVGQFKVGHFYEPMSIEQLTTDLYTTFMERSLFNDLLPERNVGMAISNTALDDNLTWAAGVYRETDNFGAGANDSGGIAVTGRVTGLLYYRDGGRQLLHFGGSASLRDIDGNAQLRVRPESHLSPLRFVDTGVVNTDDIRLFGNEVAWVSGPFSIQGEYLLGQVKLMNGAEDNFNGYYVFGSVFLTEEHRPYSRKSGAFGRIKPLKNFGFGENSGWGAWELAGRFSSIDLDDQNIRGGEEQNYTLGINWYLNPNMKAMFNYVHADIDHDLYSGGMDAVQSRFQVDF